MDRNAWLKEMRKDCEAKYDDYATLYGQGEYGTYSAVAHRQFIQAFLERLPSNSRILSAACGTGRFFPELLAPGHSVIGIDQSAGMLAQAKVSFPTLQFERIGLQEIAYQEEFDGLVCIDAIENVPPEEWLLVLGNFHRALKPGGCLYFTAETIESSGDEAEIKAAFERATAAGLPVVFGEYPDEEVYHYHPTNLQVNEMTQRAGFEILNAENGELWYYHLLGRKMA